MPVLSISSTSTSPAASTARPEVAMTLACIIRLMLETHRRPGALPLGHHREHAAAGASCVRDRWRRGWVATSTRGDRRQRPRPDAPRGLRRPHRPWPIRSSLPCPLLRGDAHPARTAPHQPDRQRLQVQRRSRPAECRPSARRRGPSSVADRGPGVPASRTTTPVRALLSRRGEGRASATSAPWRRPRPAQALPSCAMAHHGHASAFARRRHGGSRFTLTLPIEPQPEAGA